MKFYLEKMLNKKVNLVHFIGIGGANMSSLAQITLSKGIAVTGSDIKRSNYTEGLSENGAIITIGHDENNITDNCDLVVYAAVIDKENPEMIRAKELNIPLMELSNFLGILTKDYSQTIAVSGSYGKTTTCSLLSALLYRANLDPTVSIGDNLDVIGGNYLAGHSEYFITEICECIDNFLGGQHKIGIVLNIDFNHTKYYKTIKQLKESFHQFAKIVPKDGLLIAYGDSKEVCDVIENLEVTVATYGLKNDNQWQAFNITYDDSGMPEFDVYNQGSFFSHFKLNLPGEHNVLNALAAIVCANYLGIINDDIAETLASFPGVHRRFEFKGEVNGIKVIEDSCEHPTALNATIQACTNFKYNKLWVVFQPYTHSMTHTFFNEFVNSFKGADFVIINDTYSTSDEKAYRIREMDLAKAIKDRLDIPTLHLSEFKEIVKYLVDNVGKDDLILITGAGDINTIAPEIIQALEKKYED